MKIKMKDKKFLINNLIIGVFGVLILIVSGITIGYFDYQNFKTKEIERINRNGMIVANRFQTIIGSFYLSVKMLDCWIDKNPNQDPRFDSEFNKMVETYREHTKNKMDIRMVTPDGKLYYFPSKKKEPLADVKDREYYKAHVGKNIEGVYFAEPVLSRVTGKWGIPISYRVKAKNNRVFILFGAIEFPTLNDIFDSIDFNKEGAVLLARKDGEILYRKPFDKDIVSKKKMDLLNEDEEIKVEKNISIIRKKGEERRLVGYSNIEGFPVIAVVSENYDRSLNKWKVGFIIKMVIILAGILLFIILNSMAMKFFRQLQKANETKDKFLALIAHDIKGPIGNGVILMEYTLEDKEKISKNEIIDRIDTLKDSMKNMYELLDNLLNWAILQKQQIIFKPVNTNTEIILSECLDVLYPIAEMKKIKIIYDKQESFQIFADKQMMVTVFRNFISNAIKFTNENGVIKINVKRNGGKVEISIEDTGVGIEKERVEKLFDLYKQESTFGTKNEKGTGLGLVLCKEFIETNRGKIYVKSELGKGSTFTVILPLRT